RGLGEHEGVVFRHEADARPEPDLACASRCVCEGRKGIGDRSISRPGKFPARIGVLRLIIFEQHNVLWRPNRGKTQTLGSCLARSPQLGIACRYDPDSKISDLHDPYSTVM